MRNVEENLYAFFKENITPLNQLSNELKSKLKIQMSQVTMKLQSLINGKEEDTKEKKIELHKTLAKHVTKACNAR